MKLYTVFVPLFIAAGSLLLLAEGANAKPFVAVSERFHTTNNIHDDSSLSSFMSTTTARRTTLALRGGEGINVDPTEVAKWYFRSALVQGLFSISAPSKMVEFYGAISTPLRDWLSDCLGQGLVSMFVFSHCLLDRNLDVNHAFAYAMLNWLLFNMRQIISDDAINAGAKKNGFFGGAILHTATCFAVFSGHDWANNLVKTNITFWVVLGLIFAFQPRLAGKLYGIESDVDDVAVSQLKSIGTYLLSHFGCAGLMVFKDMSTVKAAGYSALPWILHTMDTLFISKDVQKTLGDAKPVFFWLVVQCLTAYFILK